MIAPKINEHTTKDTVPQNRCVKECIDIDFPGQKWNFLSSSERFVLATYVYDSKCGFRIDFVRSSLEIRNNIP